jgi:hypothetical protein
VVLRNFVLSKQFTMKNITKLFTLLLAFSIGTCISITQATTYYVSPTGTSTAAGTISVPLAFSTAIAKALVAGDSILARGGMYSFSSLQQISKSGSSAKFIFIGAYKSETPILDFRTQAYNSSNQGVKLSGDYVHFKGFTIQGAGDNGLQVTGSYNKIELCVTRWNCDAGTQMKTGSNNLILNCDSYENFDYESGGIAAPDFGGNADGFADKQYTNTGTNTYKGCRSWKNGDDGWDSYEKVGNTVYDSCWCYIMSPATFDMTDHIRFKTDSASWFYQFKNASGRYVMTNYGNGNGFKLGGNYTANNATLHNCVSVGNPVKGFDQNNNNGIMTIYNCTSYNNGYNYGFSNSSYGTLIIKNCASLTTKSSNSFNSKSVTQAYNSWNTGFSCATSDFVSLDATQMLNARQADGSLPEVTLLHLKSTSTMIDKGINVGYLFLGTAPDLGAYEYSPTTAVEQTYFNATVHIYPNPIKEKAVISLNAESNDKLTINLFDTTGRLIISSSAVVCSGINEIELNTALLNKGNYICRINGKELTCSFKLIK